MYQADALINQLVTDKKVDFVMSSDVDYPVQNGDKCISIKEYTGAHVTLTSTCKKTLESVVADILPGRQDRTIL